MVGVCKRRDDRKSRDTGGREGERADVDLDLDAGCACPDKELFADLKLVAVVEGDDGSLAVELLVNNDAVGTLDVDRGLWGAGWWRSVRC